MYIVRRTCTRYYYVRGTMYIVHRIVLPCTMYFQYKTPMDDIHMNKLRDVVYYILQVIVPGLPTDALPRSYVEWRPIVWLSRSSE